VRAKVISGMILTIRKKNQRPKKQSAPKKGKYFFGKIKSNVTFATASKGKKNGSVVQLVRIHACHAWGRGFESRPNRQ